MTTQTSWTRPAAPRGPTRVARTGRGRGTAVGTALLAGLWASGAAAADLLDPIGPVMQDQSTHFAWSATIALVAVLPAILMLPVMLWRYRAGGRGVYTPEWEFSRAYETAIWTIPVLVVCALAVWLVQATLRLDPDKPLSGGPILAIDLVGLDDRFLALYPDQRVAALDEIVVPVGRPVTFRLTTDTVMQSFLPNGFAGQIYAMPGMVTELNLAADREGEGTATQTQFNGAGFANMRVPMRAVTAQAFDRWLAGASGAPLDAATYPALPAAKGQEEEYAPQAPRLRPLADPCLFDRVVARYHQNAPVPAEAQPGSTTYDSARAALPGGSCDALRGAFHAHGG